MGDDRSGATKGDASPEGGIDLSDLVTLYMQQNSAVNQLWTMYAVTAFTASIFAFNVGKEAPSLWLLLAGAAGFLFFTAGHGLMVYHAVTRLRLAAADIARMRGESGDGTKKKKWNEEQEADPKVVGYLALRVNVKAAIAAHMLIDACVFLAFAVQLARLP